MKIGPWLASAFFAGVAASAVTTRAEFTTTPFYDPTNTPPTVNNAVDQSAAFSSSTGSGIGAANVTNVGTFTTGVAAAHAANFGGVVDFELPGTVESGSIVGRYGGGNKTLTIHTLDPGDAAFNMQATTTSTTTSSNGRTAISGTRMATSAGLNTFRLVIGAIAGGAVGEAVTQFAFTVLDRLDHALGQVTAIATFTNGIATATATATAYINQSNNGNDTFFGFVAPDGWSISQIDVNVALPDGVPPTTIAGFDDSAFITSVPTVEATVPEPGGLMSAAIGGTVLFWWRRRSQKNKRAV